MKIKIILLIVLFLLCIQVTMVSASEITIEDADTIWNTTVEYSEDLTNVTSNVTTRVLAEYANSIYYSHLNLSTDLTTVTSNVTPRVLAEYANSIYRNDLDEIPPELVNLTKEVPANRLIIEYATTTWSTSLSPPPFIKPEVEVLTNKYEYATCETMNITIRLANPTNSTQHAWFLWYLHLPDYDYWLRVMTTQITLPPSFDESFNFSMHIGDWGVYSFNATWYVALVDKTTYEVVCDDTANWRYVPGAEAHGETIPEEIGKEIMKKVEGVEEKLYIPK